jgi:subtilisin family serine protease
MKRIALICALTVLSLSASAFAEGKKYIIVLHSQNMIPASVEKAIQDAGGTITTRVPEVGALGVESANPDFLSVMQANKNVEAIGEDVIYQMVPTPQQMNLQPAPADAVESPGPDTQTGPDSFYNPYQWDKKRIRASNQGSYSLQQGRRDVVVAVLDTGAQVIPIAHPDIAPHLDFARSRSFVAPAPPGGDPAPTAWDDKHGHGSHTISNVGAPVNGVGMVGVAPNVTVVSLKVLSDTGAGSFLWLAQALVYAGINKFDVASMSLGGYIPRYTPDQIELKIVQRAVNFARENGVTPVAALGNENFDLSDGHFMGPYLEVPGEVDGVIGVSATDYYNNKASYSNYGVGKTDVSAPGGDFNAPPPHFGLVLGAWASDSTTLPGANYALAAGTSMACPNVAGVCALIISQYGDFTTNGNGRKPHMSPQQVESILQLTANNQPCPSATTCDGGDGYSNYFGKGIVDALKAITK